VTVRNVAPQYAQHTDSATHKTARKLTFFTQMQAHMHFIS